MERLYGKKDTTEDICLCNAKIMSALSTPMRLQILDMLSAVSYVSLRFKMRLPSHNQRHLTT